MTAIPSGCVGDQRTIDQRQGVAITTIPLDAPADLANAEVATLLTADAGQTKPGFLGAELQKLRSGASEYRYVRAIPDDESVMLAKEGWPR